MLLNLLFRHDVDVVVGVRFLGNRSINGILNGNERIEHSIPLDL